jgi:phosphopantothenate-cysteine ligase
MDSRRLHRFLQGKSTYMNHTDG